MLLHPAFFEEAADIYDSLFGKNIIKVTPQRLEELLQASVLAGTSPSPIPLVRAFSRAVASGNEPSHVAHALFAHPDAASFAFGLLPSTQHLACVTALVKACLQDPTSRLKAFLTLIPALPLLPQIPTLMLPLCADGLRATLRGVPQISSKMWGAVGKLIARTSAHTQEAAVFNAFLTDMEKDKAPTHPTKKRKDGAAPMSAALCLDAEMLKQTAQALLDAQIGRRKDILFEIEL